MAFRPRSRTIILGASAVAVSGAADTAENILATVNVPAGAMGLNGILRVYSLWTFTNGADDKICRVRLGGIGGTAFGSTTATTSATLTDFRQIANRGAANSQVSTSSGVQFATSSGATVTGAIDTSAATTLVLTGQKETGANTLTLEAYTVELLIP